MHRHRRLGCIDISALDAQTQEMRMSAQTQKMKMSQAKRLSSLRRPLRFSTFTCSFLNSCNFLWKYFSYSSMAFSSWASSASSRCLMIFWRLVPSGIQSLSARAWASQMKLSSTPYSARAFLRMQKRKQMQLSLLWVLRTCCSKPSSSKSIWKRSCPQMQQVDSSSSLVESPSSRSSPNLSMIVPEKISKITFCAKRMYMISAMTLKLSVMQVKSEALVARKPDPALRLWSTSISRQVNSVWQVVPYPTSLVKDAQQMRMEKMQLKTISRAAATNRLNHVSSIARTIVFPSSIRFTMYTSRNPAKRGCIMVRMEHPMQQRSKNAAERTCLAWQAASPSCIWPSCWSSCRYLYSQRRRRKGTLRMMTLTRRRQPQARLTREQRRMKKPTRVLGARQVAKERWKECSGVAKSSRRQPRTMRTLIAHTNRQTLSSFWTSLATRPTRWERLSISLKQSSSPWRKSKVSCSKAIRLLIFSSWLMRWASWRSRSCMRSVILWQRGMTGKKSWTRLPKTLASMVAVRLLKNSQASQYLLQKSFISSAKGSRSSDFMRSSFFCFSEMEEKNLRMIFCFSFSSEAAVSASSSPASRSTWLLCSISWKQKNPIIRKLLGSSFSRTTSLHGSSARSTDCSLQSTPSRLKSSQIQIRLIFSSSMGSRMRSLLSPRSLARTVCRASFRREYLKRFSRQPCWKSISCSFSPTREATLMPLARQNPQTSSVRRSRRASSARLRCQWIASILRASTTTSGNLLSITQFWLAWLHPFSMACTQSSSSSAMPTTATLRVRAAVCVRLTRKQKELQILSRKSVEALKGCDRSRSVKGGWRQRRVRKRRAQRSISHRRSSPHTQSSLSASLICSCASSPTILSETSPTASRRLLKKRKLLPRLSSLWKSRARAPSWSCSSRKTKMRRISQKVLREVVWLYSNSSRVRQPMRVSASSRPCHPRRSPSPLLHTRYCARLRMSSWKKPREACDCSPPPSSADAWAISRPIMARYSSSRARTLAKKCSRSCLSRSQAVGWRSSSSSVFLRNFCSGEFSWSALMKFLHFSWTRSMPQVSRRSRWSCGSSLATTPSTNATSRPQFRLPSRLPQRSNNCRSRASSGWTCVVKQSRWLPRSYFTSPAYCSRKDRNWTSLSQGSVCLSRPARKMAAQWSRRAPKASLSQSRSRESLLSRKRVSRAIASFLRRKQSSPTAPRCEQMSGRAMTRSSDSRFTLSLAFSLMALLEYSRCCSSRARSRISCLWQRMGT